MSCNIHCIHPFQSSYKTLGLVQFTPAAAQLHESWALSSVSFQCSLFSTKCTVLHSHWYIWVISRSYSKGDVSLAFPQGESPILCRLSLKHCLLLVQIGTLIAAVFIFAIARCEVRLRLRSWSFVSPRRYSGIRTTTLSTLQQSLYLLDVRLGLSYQSGVCWFAPSSPCRWWRWYTTCALAAALSVLLYLGVLLQLLPPGAPQF